MGKWSAGGEVEGKDRTREFGVVCTVFLAFFIYSFAFTYTFYLYFSCLATFLRY